MKRFVIIALLLALGFAASYNQALTAADDDVVVIVNKNQKAPSMAQIKQIFMGDVETWPDGSSIKVLLNSDGQIYDAFAGKYLNLSPRSVDTAWMNKKVKFGTPEPRKVNSTVVKMMVANSPAFIGFLRRSEAGADVLICQ